jgi:hypothetical protein
MAIHDLICDKCDKIIKNVNLKTQFTLPHEGCGGILEILWQPPSTKQASVCPKERAVVWYDERTGDVRYPGRNDVPMPKRYKDAGFSRREFPSFHDLKRFEKEKGLVSEVVNFDRGSGNGI